MIDEINRLFKSLTSARGAREWLKKVQDKEKCRGEAIARLAHAKEGWAQVRETLEQGTQFYRDLGEMVADLRRQATSFVAGRVAEREKLVAKAETEQTKTFGPTSNRAPPPLPSKSPSTGVENQFFLMDLNSTMKPSFPALPPPPPPGGMYQANAVASPPSSSEPYARLFETPGLSPQLSLGTTAPSPSSTQPSAPLTRSPPPPPLLSHPYYG